MKTLKLITLMLATGLLALMSCSKDNDWQQRVTQAQLNNGQVDKTTVSALTVVDRTDGFTSEYYLNRDWVLVGDPKPEWVYGFAGRYGLIDNNGNSLGHNVVVSQLPAGSPRGYILETDVYVYVANAHYTSVSGGIAVSEQSNPLVNLNDPIPTGIEMRLTFYGTECTWIREEYRGHAWIDLSYLDKEYKRIRNTPFTIPGDAYINDWHTMKIMVGASRSVHFYLDDTYIWGSGDYKLLPAMMKDKRILLGFESPGDAGKAYQDNVRVTYPPESD